MVIFVYINGLGVVVCCSVVLLSYEVVGICWWVIKVLVVFSFGIFWNFVWFSGSGFVLEYLGFFWICCVSGWDDDMWFIGLVVFVFSVEMGCVLGFVMVGIFDVGIFGNFVFLWSFELVNFGSGFGKDRNGWYGW